MAYSKFINSVIDKQRQATMTDEEKEQLEREKQALEEYRSTRGERNDLTANSTAKRAESIRQQAQEEAIARGQEMINAQRARDIAGNFASQTVEDLVMPKRVSPTTTGVSASQAYRNQQTQQQREDEIQQILGNQVMTDTGRQQQLASALTGTVSQRTPAEPTNYSYQSVMDYANAVNAREVQANSAARNLVQNEAQKKERERKAEEARQNANPAVQMAYQYQERSAQNKIDEEKQEIAALQQEKNRLNDYRKAYSRATVVNNNYMPTAEEIDRRTKEIDEQIAAKTKEIESNQYALNEKIRNRKLDTYNTMLYADDFKEKSAFNGSDNEEANRVNGWKPTEYDPLNTLYNDYFGQIGKDERQIYNYLLNTKGQAAASEFLALLRPELDKRATYASQQKAFELGKAAPLLTTAASIINSPIRAAGALGSIYDKVVNNTVNPYALYNRPSAMISGQRSGMDERLREDVSKFVESIGGGETAQKIASGSASLVANGVIAGLESAWNGLLAQNMVGNFGMGFRDAQEIVTAVKNLPEAQKTAEVLSLANKAQKVIDSATQLTTIVMGAGAVSDSIRTAKERGLSDEQAFELGLIAGLTEYATEHVSIENLFNTDWTPTNLKQTILKGLQQGGFEASEEVVGDIVNGIADLIVSKDKNEWKTAIDAYKKEGLSDGKAFAKVLLEKGWDTLKSGISGFISASGPVVSEVAKAGIYNAQFKTHNDVQRFDNKNGTNLGRNIEDIIRTTSGQNESQWANGLADMVNAMSPVYNGNAVNRARDYLREAVNNPDTDSETALAYAGLADYLQEHRKEISELAKNKKSGANIEVEVEKPQEAQETEQTAAPGATEETTEAPVAETITAAPALNETQTEQTAPQTAQETVQAENAPQTEQNTAEENTAQTASTTKQDTRNGRNIFLDSLGLSEESTDADAAKAAYDQVRKNPKFSSRRKGLIQSVVQKQVDTLNDMRNSGQYTPEQIQQATDTAKAIDAQLRAYVNPENTQRRINALNAAMKRAGVKVNIIVDEGVGANYETGQMDRGSYREADGTIHINPYMDTQEAFYGVIAHEVFHKAADGSARRELVDDVLNARQHILDNFSANDGVGITRYSRSLIGNSTMGDYVASYSDLIKNRFGLSDEGRAAIQNRMNANPGLTEAEAMQQLCDENEEAFWSWFGTDKSGGNARDYMREEVAAHFMETLGSQQGEEILRTLLRDNRTALQKFIDAVRKILKMPERDIGDRQVYENLVNSYERLIAEESGLEAKTLKGTPNEKTETKPENGQTLTTQEIQTRVDQEEQLSPYDETKASREMDAKFYQNAYNAAQKNGAMTAEEQDMWDRLKEVRTAVKKKLDEVQNKANLPADIMGNTYFGNASYSGSEENTSVCPRTVTVDSLTDMVAEDLGRPLTVEESVFIAQEVFNYTDLPQCLYCYVAMDRIAKRALLGDYIDKRNRVYSDLDSGVTVDEALANFKESEESGGKKWSADKQRRFNMWVNKYKTGKARVTLSDLASEASVDRAMQNPDLVTEVKDAMKWAQSASWAKKKVGFAAYDGHILRWNQKRIDDLNSMFGLRMYSFSDYSPAYLLENMQMVTDAAVRGLKMLAYTKELDFVRIFAGTGMNINISVFGMDGENGTVHEDAMQGASWSESQKLRDQYDNVGVTFVATNDDQVSWALNQDWIDVVIPFHMVKTGAKVAQVFGWNNYTPESSDQKTASTKNGVKEIFPNQHQNSKELYEQALNEAGLKPRFERWFDNPNYMKLVNETRKSAQDTPAVRPVFDQNALKAAMESIDSMVRRGGYNAPIGGSLDVQAEIAEEIAEKVASGVAEGLQIRNGVVQDKTTDTSRQSREVTTKQDDDVRFSREVNTGYDYSKPFSDQIDDYIAGNFPKFDTLIVRDTPKVFRDIGLNPLPFTYGQGHLKTALANADGEHLGEAQLKKLPDALEHPIAIIDNPNHPGRLLAIIEIPGQKSNTVAAVEIDGTGQRRNKPINSNAITTVYEKKTAITKYLKDAVAAEVSGNGGVYYIDKNKTTANLITSGGQFPGITSISDGFVKSISDPNSNVKAKLDNVTESSQFKEWFGDPKKDPAHASKIVNADGTPKVVYHQTGRSFWTFDNSNPVAGARDTETPSGFFFKDNDHDIGIGGKRQIAVYLNMRSPLHFADRTEANAWYCKNIKGYSELQDEMRSAISEIEKRMDELESRMMSEDVEIGSEEDQALEKQWDDILENELKPVEDQYAKQLHEMLNEYFLKRQTKYDGIILDDDGHRIVGGKREDVHTYIVFKPNQIKSATDNIGTFDAENDDIRYSREMKELDDEYMDAVDAEDVKTEARIVREAASANGYNSPKLYHGTDAFGFTEIDSTAPGADGYSFWAASRADMSGTYTQYAKTRNISSEISDEDYDAAVDEVNDDIDDALYHFKRLIDRTFSEWYFGQGDGGLRETFNNANPEPGYGDGIYDEFESMVADAFYQYKDELGTDLDYDEWIDETDEGQALIDAVYDLEALRGKIYQLESGEMRGGIYELYANTDNMYELDANGMLWKGLHPEGLPDIGRPYKTRDVANWARNNGYDGVIFRNIHDNGKYGRTGAGDVYAFFKPQAQVKSADPVTYDDNGDVIPPSERFDPNKTDIRWSREVGAENDSRINEERDKYNLLKAQFTAKTPFGDARAINESAMDEIVKRYTDTFGEYVPEEDIKKIIRGLYEIAQRPKGGSEDTAEARYKELADYATESARKLLDASSYANVLKSSIGDENTLNALNTLYDALNLRRSDDQTGYYYLIPDMITAAGSKEAWNEIRKALNGMRLQGFNTQAEAEKSGRKSISELFTQLSSDGGAYNSMFEDSKTATDFEKISQVAAQYSLAREAFRDAYETVRTENRAENEADVMQLANDLLYAWGSKATPTVMAKAEQRVQEEREKGRERVQNARERGQQLLDEEKQKGNERLQKEKERGQKRLKEEQEKSQRRADRVRENTEKREAAMEERFDAAYERMRKQYERRQQKAEEKYDKFVEKIRQRDIRTATKALNGQIAKRLKKFNQWLEKPQKENGKHIPQKLRPVVAKVLESVLSGTGDIKLSNSKTMTADRMRQIQQEELLQTRHFVDDLVQGLHGISAADGKNSVVTEMFLARLDEMVKELNDLRDQIKPIEPGEKGNDLTTGEKALSTELRTQEEESAEAYYQYLLTIKNMLDMTMKTLRDENRMISNGKAMDLQTVMEPLKEDIIGRKSLPTATEHRKLFNMMNDRLRNMKFSGLSGDLLFKLLGDNWHDLVMHSFREGQNRQAQHEAQFADMMKELTDGYDFTNAGYNGEFVKLKKPDAETSSPYLSDSEGSRNRNDDSNTFNATRAQIMQLYALWQRPDARRHLENGGACFTNERGQDFIKNTYKVTPELFEEWTSVLTDEEKEIADGIVKFLTEEASEWGNDVSKYVYGYRMYNDDHYFPMDVADYSLNRSNTNIAREPSPLNPSFSHATTKSVKPLSLTNIFDVANDHVRKMSIYNAYAAACNDLDRIVSDQDMNQLLLEKFGNGALDAIKEFIQTTGGMKLRTAEESQALNWRALANFRMNNYKRQAVLWNLSTAVKQGISIVRAANVIDPKYLAAGVVAPGTEAYKEIRDKMQSMSGVAYIKSLGYSDTGFGKTIQQLYDPNALNDSGIIRGALSTSKGGRGLIRAYDKFTDMGMWLAAKADEWTWVNLWNAASKEVQDQNPNASQEELDKLTTQRFNDIIGETQVVDTALDTAPIMRSKMLQVFLPFMNEPTKSLGNLILAADRIKTSGGGKQFAKVLTTTAIANMILEPIITTLFSMWRDEKDDSDKFWESFMEKMFGIKEDGSTNYKSIISSNFFGGLWQYPFIQGVYDAISNAMQNYDNTSIDNAAIIDTAKAAMALFDNAGKSPSERMKTQNRLWRDFIEQMAADIGIPAKTIRRQLSATARSVMNAVGANELKWEYQKLSYNLENSNARSQKGFYDILAKTYMDGDLDTYQKMMSELNEIVSDKSTLIDEKSLRQAIEKRGAEIKPGTDIWNLDVQARFRLDQPVKGWRVENFVTGAYVQAQKAGIDESVADDCLLNMPDAYEYTDEDGDTVKMNPADYLQYAADVGQLAYRTLSEMSSGANAKQWASLNADQKVVAIRDVYKYCKAKFKKDYNEDYDINHQGKWMTALYDENATPAQIAKAALEQGAAYDKELKRTKKKEN